jgi:hypothetical protein
VDIDCSVADRIGADVDRGRSTVRRRLRVVSVLIAWDRDVERSTVHARLDLSECLGKRSVDLAAVDRDVQRAGDRVDPGLQPERAPFAWFMSFAR